jgi:hypothetical protein
MDETSTKTSETAIIEIVDPFTESERNALVKAEEEGVRPISPTLAAGMFQLFLEGYSCAEIAKNNKPFKEGEILFLRKKFNWDSEKNKYVQDLNVQIRDKLMKQKLESLEFLTNMLSVTHRAGKEKMLKYLQTGDPKDLPETWVSGPKSYKDVLEAIQKLTGEDRISRQEIKSESNIKVTTEQPNILTPELQTKLLKQLTDATEKK